MHPKYEVPVIPANLRREETIVQIAEALQYLSDVSTDIFKRIDSRIAQNKAQVTNISKRIGTARTKLNKLSGAKKATQVFSSCKYPGEDTNRPYKSIFDNEAVLPLKKFDYEYKSSQVADEQLEALKFYHVKVKSKTEKSNTHGLGEPPSDLETVNDILLFNTGRNAYDKEKSHDKSNSSMLNAIKRGRDESEVDIGAAPFSISQGQGLGMQKVVGENYFYSPHLGNVPAIDVPLDLPDLPGIADDLRYQTEQEPNIAPSVAGMIVNPHLANVIPDLPEIEDDHALVREESPKVVAPPAAAIQTNVAPAPPPTPIANQESQPADSRGSMEDNRRNNNKDNAVRKDSLKEHKEESKPGVPLPSITGSDARASLMDAIRHAGGLKSLKPKKEESLQSQKQSAPVKTGDLMADLHAKLSMRRKGISGNKSDNPTTMDKISEMIPPPPAAQSDKSDSAEEEWDD